jgi:hypothetical protein
MVVKVWHVFDGIFLCVACLSRITRRSCHVIALLFSWEFVTTLGFEWNVIRGHRPYRWTIWVSGDGPLFGNMSSEIDVFLVLDLLPDANINSPRRNPRNDHIGS